MQRNMYAYHEWMKIYANERKQTLLQQYNALSAAFRSLAGMRERAIITLNIRTRQFLKKSTRLYCSFERDAERR